MGLLGVIKLNRRMLDVLNSCERTAFMELVNELMHRPNPMKYFTKRYYIWNIVRHKDFYKMTSFMVSDLLRRQSELEPTDPDGAQALIDDAIWLIDMVLDTAINDSVRRAFVWNVAKYRPILTLRVLPYLDEIKIQNCIQSGKEVIVDDQIRPFLQEIKNLREENDGLRSLIDNV